MDPFKNDKVDKLLVPLRLRGDEACQGVKDYEVIKQPDGSYVLKLTPKEMKWWRRQAKRKGVPVEELLNRTLQKLLWDRTFKKDDQKP